MRLFVFLLLIMVLIGQNIFAKTITLHKYDATVWAQDLVIKGSVDTLVANNGLLSVNGEEIPFNIEGDKSFTVPVHLGEGRSVIFAKIDSAGSPLYSDTLRLTLGYRPRPEIYPRAEVDGRTVTLHANIIENPGNRGLSFRWSEAPENPAQLGWTTYDDSTFSFLLGEQNPAGEYYFNLSVSTADYDTVHVRTLVTNSAAEVRPFDIRFDHARWIDDAVLYEITPYIFVGDGKFEDITAKIPEIAGLGVTAIWLQPVFNTYYGGQGYDITDYFSVRSDLGSGQDLRELIAKAKKYNLRVLFDFVANHSSIKHSYAQESILYGEDSHYYDFYQRSRDSAPYAQHYHSYQGFINYFWNNLPNLNYDNPEVRRWISEAMRYWVEEYGIDGYRFDAIWGVNARRPEFMQEVRLTLKRIKPEILLLGEDKATWPMVFEERFDVAYDWAASEGWVSQWAFQWDYSESGNPTVFNFPNENNRAGMLRDALTNNGAGFHERAKILRFIENNDTQRFIVHHGLERTKMAAALMFSLPGLPMIYNGQEIGNRRFPYDTYSIFHRDYTMAHFDVNDLIPFYRHLTNLRKRLSAFRSANYEEAAVSPGQALFACRRWYDSENIFTVLNLNSSARQAELTLDPETLQLDSAKTWYFTDMLSGDVFPLSDVLETSMAFDMPAYSARILVLADTVTAVGITDDRIARQPLDFTLEQNFPNPFNNATSIRFTLPRQAHVRLQVFDVLGRRVAELANGSQNSGNHEIRFDANYLASGIYIYRLEYDGKMKVRKMMLIK